MDRRMALMAVAVITVGALGGCPEVEQNEVIDAGTGGGGASGGDAGGGGGGGGGACSESWSCTYWAPVDGGMASRSCVDDNDCGTTTQKPAESAPLPGLNFNYYKCQVQPLQAQNCSMVGCHGAETGRPLKLYSRGRLRNDELICIPAMCLQPAKCNVNIGQVGYANVECAAMLSLTTQEWQKNFDSSRALAIGLTSPDDSELLTQVLEGSSRAHLNLKFYKDTSDPAYTTVRNWLNGATQGSCDAGPN